MQINKEIFLNLSEEKQQFIEHAFLEVKEGNITVDQFIDGCAQNLTDYEYSNLFIQAYSQQSTNKTNDVESQEEVNDASFRHSTYRKVETPEENVHEINAKKQQKNEDNIDDIMQYTHINLKEEAENIIKELCFTYNDNISIINNQVGTCSFDALFNLKMFSKYINSCCANRQIKITEDGVSVIFLALHRKIRDFVEKLDQASKIRTETEMCNYNFSVLNEHSKQMWFLNEIEKAKYDKLNMHTEKERKKKNVQEREDLIIKKRQSNSVAMAAMGVKQKSWMGNIDKIDDFIKFDSIYTPFDENIFNKRRIINKKDFLFVLERDKRYNKSLFLVLRYYNN